MLRAASQVQMDLQGVVQQQLQSPWPLRGLDTGRPDLFGQASSARGEKWADSQTEKSSDGSRT